MCGQLLAVGLAINAFSASGVWSEPGGTWDEVFSEAAFLNTAEGKANTIITGAFK
jgi:hypothetical protein